MCIFDSDTFAARLSERRRERGFSSQRAFAEHMKMAPQTLNNYESGNRLPDAETLFEIATALECSADWLIGLSDNKEPTTVQIRTVTGLSDASISRLRAFSQSDIYKAVVNATIESGAFEKLLTAVADAVKNIHVVDEWLCENKDGEFAKVVKDHQNIFVSLTEYIFTKTLSDMFEEIIDWYSPHCGDVVAESRISEKKRLNAIRIKPLSEDN